MSTSTTDLGMAGPATDPAMEWHPRLVQVFASLDRHGVAWALLRPPASPSAPTGDVDLVVDVEHREVLPALLRPLGLVQVPDGGSPDLFFLAYDEPTDCWLLLQFASRLDFGRRSGLDAGRVAALLGRRVRVGEAWVLRAEDELWVTLAHLALEKSEVPVRHRARLSRLAGTAQPGGPVETSLAVHFPAERGAAEVLACVRQERWNDVTAFAEALQRAWPAARGPRLDRRGFEQFLRLARGLRNPWRRRGVSVALLGPDGAGKSTLAEGLGKHFYLKSSSFYMDVRDAELRRVAALRVPGLTFAAYIIALWRRLLQARLRQARGELVVFDRYMYDALHETAGPVSRKQALARWLHTHLFPETAVGLVLDIPGERMFARKGERSPEDLERERRSWLALAEDRPHFHVLDASQPVDAVRRRATAIIWAEYARRWARD